MKLAISIWCGVMLSLLATRVDAQIDSNAKVTIRNSQICNGCTMTIIRTSSLDTFKTYSYEYHNLCVSVDTSYPYGKKWDNTYDGIYVSFELDSEALQIRNMSIQNSAVIQVSCDYAQCDGIEQMGIHFDSIPFTITNGKIVADGVCQGVASFQAGLPGCMNGHGVCSGGCEIIDTVMDSVFISIIPNYYSAVSSGILVNRHFNLISDSHRLYININPSIFDQRLSIYDLIGRYCKSVSIPSNTISIESALNLPSGFYFARLGDQVAKFIVPPR